MAKQVVTAEGVFRMRRGVLVRIPDEWVGAIPTRQTISERQSHKPRRGRPRPTTRMKVTCEEDVDLHLRRTSKNHDRWQRQW